MPTKRARVPRTYAPKLPDEAIVAFRAADWLALHRALRLKPWEPSPLEASGPCPWSPTSAAALAWDKVREMRLALEAACAH